MKRFKKALSLLIVTIMVVSVFSVANISTVAANATLTPTSATVYNDCRVRSQATFYSGYANTQINQLENWSRLRLTAGDTNEYGSHTYDCYGWTEGTYTVQIAAGGQNWYSTPYGWLTLDNWSDGWRDAGTLTVLSGGHTWNEGVVMTEPTCTTEGSKLFTCTGCNESKTEAIEAIGHDYSSAVIAPTCTAEGYTTYRCTVCGDSYSDSTVPALGHSWDDGVVLIAPTLEEMGTTRYTCTKCDATNDVQDIPVLSGLDVQIYIANELIEKYLNGEFVTTKTGFDSDWTSFTDVYYDSVTVVENGTSEEKEAAEQALAAQIANINNYLSLDITDLENAVALTPEKAESYYTADSYSAWYSLRIQSYIFLSKAAAGQISLGDKAEKDALVSDLTSAYNNLTIKDADYSRVDSLLEQYQAINRNNYTSEDLAYVDGIIENAVVRGYKIDRQDDVDAMAQTIEEALAYLDSLVIFEITDETTAIIEGDMIYGFEEGVTESDIQSMISYIGTASMEIVETPNGLGTGSQIIFKDADGNVLKQLTVVVFGDANGDGWIDVFDSAIVSEIANSGDEADECVCKALDVNNDEFIDAYDISLMTSIINMEVSISQDGRFTVA